MRRRQRRAAGESDRIAPSAAALPTRAPVLPAPADCAAQLVAPPPTARLSAAGNAVLQIHGVALLLGLGLALCWCSLVAELRFHTFVPQRAVALPLAFLALGAILGVVAPALALRRATGVFVSRLNRLDATGGVLCALLLLPCGIAWSLAISTAAVLESLRFALAGALMVSPGALLLLVWALPALALIGSGAALSVACAGLHGWRRELGFTRPTHVPIWSSLLSAAAVGAVLSELCAGPTWFAIPGAACIFAAAVAATVRFDPACEAGASRPLPDAPCPAGGGAWALPSVVLAGAALAATIADAVRPEREALGIGGATGVLSAAAACSCWLPVRRLRTSSRAALYLSLAACLLHVALRWAVPRQDQVSALLYLAPVGVLGMLALLVAARQLAVHFGGTQRGLAACIAFGGAGVVCGALLAPGPASPSMIDGGRAGTVVAPRVADNPASPPPSELLAWLRDVPGLRALVVAAAPTLDAPGIDSWQRGLSLDLEPYGADVILVVDSSDAASLSPAASERAARRWFRGLRAGGRLLVVSAGPRTAEAVIWEWQRHQRASRLSCWRAGWAGARDMDLLAIGPDIPAFFAAAIPPMAPQPQLDEVTGLRQFSALRGKAPPPR